jgi:hypothetical protein
MKLTKATVEQLKLPSGKTEAIVFDDALAGFRLRIRAGGKRIGSRSIASGPNSVV